MLGGSVSEYLPLAERKRHTLNADSIVSQILVTVCAKAEWLFENPSIFGAEKPHFRCPAAQNASHRESTVGSPADEGAIAQITPNK
jgi:hypothetical protein